MEVTRVTQVTHVGSYYFPIGKLSGLHLCYLCYLCKRFSTGNEGEMFK